MTEVIEPVIAFFDGYNGVVTVSIKPIGGAAIVTDATATNEGNGKYSYQPVFTPPSTKTKYWITWSNGVYTQQGELILGDYDYITSNSIVPVGDITTELDAHSTKLAHLNADISSRASQTSVDDLPTNSELATALSGLTVDAPTKEEIRAEMDSNSTKLAHLDADISDIPTLIMGGGSKTYTETMTGTSGVLIEGLTVEVWTDSGYTSFLCRQVSNVFGQVTFHLNPGTYYCRSLAGFGYEEDTWSKVVT
jgi:hypothetical protein